MEKANISQYRLLKSGIDNRTLDSLKKNKNITMLTLEKLCVILNCSPNSFPKSWQVVVCKEKVCQLLSTL